MSSSPFDNSSPTPSQGRSQESQLDETSGIDAVPASDETSAFNSRTRLPKNQRKPGKSEDSSIGGYSLGQMLGQGGMGRVYRADDSNGRSVALKLLSPDLARSPEALARFKQEGLIASQINHPHCVFVHRVDEDAGTPFIAMELMTGLTLKDLVQKKGALPYREATRLILQCIDGLMEAHSLGMIHRDIKPANCYLDDDGNVKVGDFGLARSLVSDSELTQTGAFLGTPLFASPEQLLGRPIDARSDIYSLTATFYYLLAGKAPFESPHAAQVIARIASSDPPKFKESSVEVPEALEKIVMKGLARDASKRYSSFAEMRDELQFAIEPTAQVTSLPRRFFAWLLDYFVLTALISLIMISFLNLKQLQSNSIWSQVIGTIVVVTYYIFCESIFAASLGKAALRVTVVDAKSGGKPGFLKVLARVLVANTLSSVLSLTSKVLFPNLVPAAEFTSITMISFLNTAALCGTWWSTKKRQLTHDWLSGTECRTRLGARAVIRNVIALPKWSVPIEPNQSDGKKLPDSLGRFGITGEISVQQKTAGTKWLVGQDRQLEREVWIVCLEDKSIEYEDSLAKIPKPLRLRFIEEGEESDFRWFAYVSPESVPLTQCLMSRTRFPWPVTRSILGDIVDYTETSEVLRTGWDSNRTWVDANGRLSLVDFQCSSPHHADLLPLVAKLGLPDRHRLRRAEATTEVKSSLPPQEALAPARATKLLEALATNATTQSAQFSHSVLKKDLEEIDKKTHELSPSIRFVSSAASLGLLSPFLFFAIIMMVVPSVILIMDGIYKDVRKLKSLGVYTESPEQYEDYWKLVSSEERATWTDPEKRPEIKKALEIQSDRLANAMRSIGGLERMILSNIPRNVSNLENPSIYGPKKNNSSTGNSDEDQAVSKMKIHPGPMGNVEMSFGNEKMDEDLMRAILGSVARSNNTPRAEKGFPDFGIVIVGLVVFTLWSTLTFGGLTRRFTGFCFVSRDGHKLGVLRSFWRAAIMTFPFFVIAYLISSCNVLGYEYLWWGTQMKRLFCILPLLYLATTFIWYKRTPLDYLAGTVAIPS
jgi:eukaryotic-like serine/threonine-protein kinase